MGSRRSSSQVVGHKYFAGAHMVLGHGPMDKIVRIEVADKRAWVGSVAGKSNGYTRININMPQLFGGQSREGGISGAIDVAMGFPTQPANDYLQRNQGGRDNRVYGTGAHVYQIRACMAGSSGTCDYNSSPDFVGAARGDTPVHAVTTLIREKYGKAGGGFSSTTLTPGPDGPRYQVEGLVHYTSIVFAKLLALAEQKDNLAGHPAYRGVTALILRQMYLGNNPYLKPWTVTAQRVFRRGPEGREQWYPDTAGILRGYLGGTQAIVFALDVSGSMSGSRLDTLKSAMDLVLTNIQSSGLRHDIHIVLWSSSHTSITRRNVDSAAIADLKAFVQAASAGGGTDANQAVASAGAFYSGSSNSLPRKFLVLTDGAMSNADAAAATLFSTPGISSYGFNLGLSDTTQTDKLDNTGGAQVIPLGSGSLIARAFEDALVAIYDMNPIHIIRECLTESWGRHLPETEIGPSYQVAADQLFAEGFGISLMWTQSEPVDDFIREIIRYIDAVRYEHPGTGLQEIKLIRAEDVAEPGTLPVLHPGNSDLEQFIRPSPTEVTGAVSIKFRNWVTGLEDSLTVYDTAALNMSVDAAKVSYEYPGIRTKRLANIVGLRDIARLNRPYSSGRIRTNRTVADLLPGDPFVLVSGDEGVEFMICRVASRAESGLLNGDIILDFAEDVFGADLSIFGEPEEAEWEDPIGEPRALDIAVPTELPYVMVLGALGAEATNALNDTAAFYGLAAPRPFLGDHFSYRYWIYPQIEAPVDDVLRSRVAGFTPLGVLDQAALPTDTELVLSLLPAAEYIRQNQLIMALPPSAGEVTDADRELLALASDIDATISVVRGVGDTVPRPLPVGTLLFFVDAGLGTDEVEYIAGETIEGYGAPINGQGEYAGPYDYLPLDMVGRLYKPYPPANLRVNGVSFPDEEFLDTAATFVLTWRHRDRLLQQDQVIDWFEDVDYGPESGTTYRVVVDAYDVYGDLLQTGVIDENVGLVATYDADFTLHPLPAETVFADLQVWADRGGEQSLQAANTRIRFFAPPFNLTGEFIPD